MRPVARWAGRRPGDRRWCDTIGHVGQTVREPHQVLQEGPHERVGGRVQQTLQEPGPDTAEQCAVRNSEPSLAGCSWIVGLGAKTRWEATGWRCALSAQAIARQIIHARQRERPRVPLLGFPTQRTADRLSGRLQAKDQVPEPQRRSGTTATSPSAWDTQRLAVPRSLPGT